jgi:hypothetical protein
VTDDARSQATRWTRLRDVVPRVVEHMAAISPRPDMSDSWPDEGGAARRSVGSMEVGHKVHSRHTSRKSEVMPEVIVGLEIL